MLTASNNSLVFRMDFNPPCTPDSHPHGVTNTKSRIDTLISPDDGHIVTRNMYRKEINILRQIVHYVGFIYRLVCSYLKTFVLWIPCSWRHGAETCRNFIHDA
jgi:hypothetical protein